VIIENMVNSLSLFEFSNEKMAESRRIMMRILPIIAFVPPFLILYSLYPATFEATWKGRTFYLFFLWLVSLEVILNWDKVQEPKISKVRSARTALFLAVLALPTIYVIVSNYFGVNDALVSLAGKYKVDPSLVGWVPLSTEYLVFTVLFASIIYLGYGIGHLKNFALPTIFLAAIGMMYTIDNFYPNGTFTPFQIPVPITTQLAASVLNLIGHATKITETTGPPYGWLSILHVIDPKTGMDIIWPPISIAWPCAGVESLIIYTITILIFLKNSAITWTRRTIYFVLGAVVTFFINVLRIVTLFTIALQYGDQSPQFNDFHYYYGQLYSITWIMLYPLIIMGGQLLWNRVKSGINEKVVRETSNLPLPAA
jgi:thaumarchaeosortase